MTVQDAILLGMEASIMMSVLAIGLDTSFGEASHLVRHPRELLNSVISMDLIMPAFAIAAVLLLPLTPPVKLALVALSVSPVPAGFPKTAKRMGGTEAYSVGLLVVAAVTAVVFVPVAIEVIGPIFGLDIHMSWSSVARLMITAIVVPLLAGMAIRMTLPQLAARLERPLILVADVALALMGVVIVVAAWPQVMALIGNGTIAVFVGFVVVALVTGHYLGGPNPKDRTVLAVATAMRHPGVAVAIAATNFPGEPLPAAAVLLYMLVSGAVIAPYAYWRRHYRAAGYGHGTTG